MKNARYTPYLADALRRAQFAEGDESTEDEAFTAEVQALLDVASNAEAVAALDDAALEQLRADLAEAFNAAAPNVTSDAQVDALETIAQAISSIEGTQDERTTAATARAERIAT